MDDRSAWALEERFWLEGAGVYDELLDPACLMAFPSMGVMRTADVLDSLRQAPRWNHVSMVDRAVGRSGDDLIVLGYKAEGLCGGAELYRCFCTSTYHRVEGRWLLV